MPRPPTSFYMALCDGGPPTMIWLGAPDQGADQGPDSVVGPSREDINLTFSPLISLLNLNLKILYLFPFHLRLVHNLSVLK